MMSLREEFCGWHQERHLETTFTPSAQKQGKKQPAMLVHLEIQQNMAGWQWHQLGPYVYGPADATAMPSSVASLKARLVSPF